MRGRTITQRCCRCRTGPVRLRAIESGGLERHDPLDCRDVSVEARDHHPDRIAVFERQRITVHPDRRRGIAAVGQSGQRSTGDPAVDAGRRHHVGVRGRAGRSQEVLQAVAGPGRVDDDDDTGIETVVPGDREPAPFLMSMRRDDGEDSPVTTYFDPDRDRPAWQLPGPTTPTSGKPLSLGLAGAGRTRARRHKGSQGRGHCRCGSPGPKDLSLRDVGGVCAPISDA